MADDDKMKTSRRGRPSVARVAAIESAIMSAAGDLFLRDGFDVVTMEAVAAVAGISKTTLYARFPSKERLLDAIIRDRIVRWSDIASSRDHLMPSDPRERMLYHATTMARTSSLPDVQAFLRLVQGNSERFPSLARAMYDVGYLYIVAFVRADIEAVAAQDGRPIRDADGVARHFVSAVTGWVQQESAGGDLSEARVEAAALRCAELLLAARDSW